MKFRDTDSDDIDDVDHDEWLEEDEPKLRIIQNTTDIPNDTIKYIMEFINPLLAPEIDRFKQTPLDLGIRVIYESERDNEFLDNGCLGSYIPEMYYSNNDGLVIVEKAILSIIIPDRGNGFPLYSNYPIIRYAESKGLKITKELLKELREARMKKGNSVIIYLSLEELLVHIIAHELRHHWQYFIGFGKNTDEMSSEAELEQAKIEKEKDADAYAVKQVRLWRKFYSPKDAYPDANCFMN